MKKALSLLLALTLLCGIFSIITLATNTDQLYNYRWETRNDTIVSVSTNGNTENVLTMTDGSIVDGKLSGVKYTIEQSVVLKHDKPWAIEWKSSGTWSDTTDGALLFAGADSSYVENAEYLYRRHNSDFIAFGVRNGGQYHNYGVSLSANGINGTIEHVYRLENRINADGSNMVYLYVDDREIAPMNHHWVGGTDKKETVDWLNGRDLTFTHMGTSPHTIGNCYIDYIQVWENGHTHIYNSVVTYPDCTEQGYTTYTCTCGDSYIADYVESSGHQYINNVCVVCGEHKPETRKTISILGDSISTYSGYSNGAASATTNSTIKNGAVYYPRSGFDITVESTWWHQAAQELGMDILVNNSWSGSCLLNTRSGTVGAYIDRCVQLHDDTGDNAGQKPDIIAIFLGTNDYYTYPSTLGSYESIGFDTLITQTESGYVYATPTTSMEAYAVILHKISQSYPESEVYCFTLLPRVNSSSQPTSVNEDIKQLTERFGAALVDLYGCGVQPNSTHMGDDLHPNSAGMDAITNAFVSAVLKNSGKTTCDVNFILDDVIAMEGTTRTVIYGQPLKATLKAKTDSRYLNVTVRVGNVDVTGECYANGVVQIPAVTNDVVITAFLSEREPMSFYWEYDAQKNDLISMSGNGNTENVLTMTSGSITAGKFSGVKYTIEQAVILKHDKPWVIEWKSSGTWSDTTDGALLFAGDASSTVENAEYLYRRHNSDFIAFGVRNGGQYHNYGVSLSANGINGTIEHVYRLENRINADGSNMVYLYVDDREIAPMNHHWVGGTDKKETVDWLNGRDLTFTNMGTSPHTIGNCYIDYIKVLENGASQTSTFEILDTRCDRVETFTYEVGMTWHEWLSSKYNTGMGSCVAIWVSDGPGILGSNPNMDIFVNGDRADYNAIISGQDTIELVKYR